MTKSENITSFYFKKAVSFLLDSM